MAPQFREQIGKPRHEFHRTRLLNGAIRAPPALGVAGGPDINGAVGGSDILLRGCRDELGQDGAQLRRVIAFDIARHAKTEIDRHRFGVQLPKHGSEKDIATGPAKI